MIMTTVLLLLPASYSSSCLHRRELYRTVAEIHVRPYILLVHQQYRHLEVWSSAPCSHQQASRPSWTFPCQPYSWTSYRSCCSSSCHPSLRCVTSYSDPSFS